MVDLVLIYRAVMIVDVFRDGWVRTVLQVGFPKEVDFNLCRSLEVSSCLKLMSVGIETLLLKLSRSFTVLY